ncbi:hypothetical protein OG410_22875 [Streptomyces sp. NBC_00659]|uniref:hypothetical protein n=1 Tax=Streptomyces sp. NBC_00659 TaxID=2903669 RepID=UPI002E2F3DF1|nr:hypothetical protein [Streptomyces sp. NBC_00659]
MRLRIERTDWLRPGLYLTDTPRPHCRDCGGHGVQERDYGDETGEYVGTNWAYYACWNANGRWLLLPIPRKPLPRPGPDPWASNEPPL